MDKRSSLEKRYSFNIAQGNPVAESTHINGRNFSWGSSMNQKHCSYSNLCVNEMETPSSLCNGSIFCSKPKHLMKVGARIATDIQSKGLASRVVKYHESGTRLNRSMSAHNLYNKPGHFPLVTLKKTSLPYRAAKQELSMIRIPPPEKSSFYGNTISGLLRSSSVIGLQSKRNEDVSRENRPIIHPPPTEDDMAPTRSVLEVLKEISRKRINSDDLESEEASKKYCNRSSIDFVDTINNNMSAIDSSFVSTALSCKRYKRQRDCSSGRGDVQPKQVTKRVCNYNNDITSSLSSSAKYKRVATSNLGSSEIQRLKVQRYNDCNKTENKRIDMGFEDLENKLRKEDEINPKIESIVQNDNMFGGVVPKITESIPLDSPSKTVNKNLQHPTEMPRLTLFNKKFDGNENGHRNDLRELIQDNADDSIDQNSCVGISFVKPKKISSKSGLRNPIMQKTQKSKLALMLSGLRGELNINPDVDELDSGNDKKKHQTSNDNNKDNANGVISSTTITAKTTTITSSNNIETNSSNMLVNFSTKTTSAPSPIPLTNKTLSPLVGLKTTKSNSSCEKLSNALHVGATKSPESQSKTNVPVLGGFSFCTTTSTSSNNILQYTKSITTPISSVPTVPNDTLNFGQKSAALSLENKNTEISNYTLPPTSATSTASNSSNTANTFKVTKGFTFGSNANGLISSSNTSTSVGDNTPSNTTTKSNGVFNFTVPSTSLSSTVTPSMPLMKFGTATCSATETTKTTSIAQPSANTITFSVPVTSAKISISANTPSFNFNTITKSSSIETTPISTSGNLMANSFASLATSSKTTTKTQPASSSFTFISDTKCQNSSSDAQSNQVVENLIGNNTFNANTSSPFEARCINTKETDCSDANYGNITNSPANVFNSSSTLPSFSSSSLKSVIQTFGSNLNNKSVISATPTAFDGNSNTNAATALFSFGSKSNISPTTSTNNVIGGFNFSTAISKPDENQLFGSNEQIKILNNSFKGTSTSDSKNTFTFDSSTSKSNNAANIFGGVVNKQTENMTSPGGFSFGSATPVKNTFTFGTANNIPANIVASSTNTSTGFSFSTSPMSKLNEISSNKPFSFGSPQPAQEKEQMPTSNGSSLNIFGLSDVTEKTKPRAFNFNTGNSQNVQSNISAINIFASPPSNITTNHSDRPMRRATRRLQK